MQYLFAANFQCSKNVLNCVFELLYHMVGRSLFFIDIPRYEKVKKNYKSLVLPSLFLLVKVTVKIVVGHEVFADPFSIAYRYRYRYDLAKQFFKRTI